RAVNGNALVLQLLAEIVDVVDADGEMPEIAPAGIDLGIPVVGELDRPRFILARGGEEDQRVAATLIVGAANLLEAEALAIEAQARLDIGHAHHGVQVFHENRLLIGWSV